MKRTIQIGASASVAAVVLFATGFFLGRNSIETNVYDAPISDAESPLLGRWQISSNVAPIQSTIDFRRDRTAVKRVATSSLGMVMTWGRISDELSFQNGHYPGEEGDYVPPALFRVVKIDQDQIRLLTYDGQIEWKLARL